MTGQKRQNASVASIQNYRQIEALNQSMLKKFDDDPMLFFSEFILGQPKIEKPTNATTIGSLVDFILLDCGGEDSVFEQRMHEKFGLFDGVRSTAQAFDLADEVFTLMVLSRDSNGVAQREFSDAFKEAFIVVQGKGKYKSKKWEDGLNDFNEKAKEYFKAKIDNFGKTVVDLWQIEKAKTIIAQAKGDEFHGEIVNATTGGDVEVIDKLAIEFEYKDWVCKMEQDRTIINHSTETIIRIDYKTAYDNEDFEYSYFKRKYYLQNSFYHIGTRKWAQEQNIGGYDILPMEFLVFDTSVNSRRPLLYKTDQNMVLDGLDGFARNSKNYKGVNQLMEEITWSNENGIWNISKENYTNRGVVNMKPYEIDELQSED